MSRYTAIVESSVPPEGTAAFSADITYTVLADRDNGDGSTSPVRFENVAPSDARWGDGWLVFPARVGVAIDVIELDHEVRFMFYRAEEPVPTECGGA